jgi:hypothetical protein
MFGDQICIQLRMFGTTFVSSLVGNNRLPYYFLIKLVYQNQTCLFCTQARQTVDELKLLTK